MADFVGAKQIDAITGISKRDLLLFDRIATTDLNRAIRNHRVRDIAAELDFLASRGVLIDVDRSNINEMFYHCAKTDQTLASKTLVSRALFMIAPLLANAEARPSSEVQWMALLGHQNYLDYQSRLIALHFNNSQLVRCSPILNELPIRDVFQLHHNAESVRTMLVDFKSQFMREALRIYRERYDEIEEFYTFVLGLLEGMAQEVLGSESERDADGTLVADVILRNLPIPDETVGWEDLLDFRADPETKAYLLALRRWMRGVSRENSSYIELQEELDDLLSAYSEHMRLARLKMTTGRLEALICVSAEMIENLAKIKWGAAARALFTMRQRRVALLEAERTAPGREVAYIVKANERFS